MLYDGKIAIIKLRNMIVISKRKISVSKYLFDGCIPLKVVVYGNKISIN